MLLKITYSLGLDNAVCVNRGARGTEGGGVWACPLPSRLGGLVESHELSQQDLGQSPGRQRF